MTAENHSEPRPSGDTLEDRLLSSAYRSAPEAFWAVAQLSGVDGYDRIEIARTRGWQAIPSWGLHGWDLGSWPLVVISHRRRGDQYELAYNVEGDITVYAYSTEALRDAATDCLAFWHWKHDGEPWVAGIECLDAVPAGLRGRFTWARLEASKEATS